MEREGEEKLDILYYKEGTAWSQEEVAKVFQYGAKKHGRNDWKSRESKVFLESHLRHLNQIIQGSTYDVESEFRHVHHAIANLLMFAERSREEMFERFRKEGLEECLKKD